MDITERPDGSRVVTRTSDGLTITRLYPPGTVPRPDNRRSGRRLGQLTANLGSRSQIVTDEFGIEYEVGPAPIFSTLADWEKAQARRARADAQRRADAGLPAAEPNEDGRGGDP
jgi:hypothetical protein